MRILGDRHYAADSGEIVTFTSSGPMSVGSIAVAGTVSTTLPATVTGGGHITVVVTAVFTGDDGGRVVIEVAGQTGADASTLRQITGIPVRSGIFVID
jgi:hypothetical protein